MEREDLYEELWARDDGWTIRVLQGYDGRVSVERLPFTTDRVPNPLTYDYVVRTLRAHGYYPVGVWRYHYGFTRRIRQDVGGE